MQEDMHYYGTYAMARAAGLRVKHARVVAYAAQYVDDATANNSEQHDDGGMLQAIATAHTNPEAIKNARRDQTEQRNVWVPFHFFPGNQGDSLSEKLQCQKDSKLVRIMVKNHIEHAVSVKDEYGPALMGVMAHVYADTFAHYGFSGVSSRNNRVDGDSFEFVVKDTSMLAYINNKFTRFLKKYSSSFLVDNWRKIVNEVAEDSVGALGHGGVGTYPDRPFLKWRFRYELDNRDSGWRDNPATYLEGAKKLHEAFGEFAEKAGIRVRPVEFSRIKSKVAEIIRLEADMKGRIEAWKKAILNQELFETEAKEVLTYSKDDWERQKKLFASLPDSQTVVDQEIYRFHQAAVYHRDYTMKQLLPRHGIVVL